MLSQVYDLGLTNTRIPKGPEGAVRTEREGECEVGFLSTTLSYLFQRDRLKGGRGKVPAKSQLDP